MKTKYKRYNIYINLKNSHKSRMHALVQKEVSLREDRPMFNRCCNLWKIKNRNINKALKRLQLYMSRNITIDESMARMIKKEYEEHNNV